VVRLWEGNAANQGKVLIKEWVGSSSGGGADMATQELRVGETLARSWSEEMANAGREAGLTAPPFVPCLGGFRVDETFATPQFLSEFRSRFPRDDPPINGDRWLIFRWPAATAISTLKRMPPPSGRNWGGVGDARSDDAQAKQGARLKAGFRAALRAVVWCHGAGIAHRSLGGGSSVYLSGEQRREASSPLASFGWGGASAAAARDPTAMLSDFAFASPLSANDPDVLRRAARFDVEGPLSLASFAVAEDLHALGWLFAELVLGGMATDASCDQVALRRVAEDVFENQLTGEGFREYADAEPVWRPGVALLDEDDGAGWQLLDTMINARGRAANGMVSAAAILGMPFLAEGDEW